VSKQIDEVEERFEQSLRHPVGEDYGSSLKPSATLPDIARTRGYNSIQNSKERSFFENKSGGGVPTV
jgi:hypothetical protein